MCVVRLKRGSNVVEKWRLEARPSSEQDVRIIEIALQFLGNEDSWQHYDDRLCVATSKKQSLFCTLAIASMKISGKYEHRGAAIHEIRRTIEERFPNRWSEHPIMDFNNHPETTFVDIQQVLNSSLERIKSDYR